MNITLCLEHQEPSPLTACFPISPWCLDRHFGHDVMLVGFDPTFEQSLPDDS